MNIRVKSIHFKTKRALGKLNHKWSCW